MAVIFLAFGIFGLTNQVNAQAVGDSPATLDFEEGGNGANWSWTTFENEDNPALQFIENPDASGINESATVAEFTARADGAPWAGTRGTGTHFFLFDDATRTISIMVWSPVISEIGIKLETASDWSQGELRVANTVTNEWEELVIDFSDFENPPAGESFNGISVFPDFREGREEDTVVYFDNISFEGFAVTGENDDNGGGGNGDDEVPQVAAPAPDDIDPSAVISVFGDAFDNIDGINFNPNWGQSTQVSFVDIDDTEMIRYGSFNYQGTEFGEVIDATSMTTISFDMWTSNATEVNFTVISTGPEERLFPLDIAHGQWVTYQIDLDYFENVDLADIFQMKFDGGDSSPTIYLDNIYFFDQTAVSIDDEGTHPTEFALSQNYPNPFNPTTQIQFTVPETGNVKLDVYNLMGQRVATLLNENVNSGSHTITFDASNLASGVYLYRLQAGSAVLTRKMTLIK